MCGIAGVVGPGAGALVGRVSAMIAALEHRGPDEHGVTVFDDAVLGNARLSIIDPEGGQQPLLGPDGRTALVCNGEIYGHQRVRAQFPDHPFTTGSDCEVALALYDRHGDDLLRHLPGTFALALWDDRRHQLLLARDRFGERPLYYCLTDGLLAFASESRALEAGGFDRGRPDPEMIGEMLRQGYVPSGRSIWSGVSSLPHASSLTWDTRRPPVVRRWWSPPEIRRRVSTEEATEWFRRELDRAVQDQLEADVPVGAFLSGGIDSTTIAALAARHHPDLHAFTFDMPGESELDHARATAELHGMTLHVLTPDVGDVAAAIEALPVAWDEPFGDSSALPTRMLSEFARRDVTVALTGDGADELLGGYLVWTRGLLDPGSAGSTEPSGRIEAQGIRGRLAARRARTAADPHRVARRFASFRQYFDADDLRSLGLPGRDARDVDVTAYGFGTADDICRFDLDHYLPGDILVKTDRASMAHGLEVRAPFLDVAVAEGCLALPADLKVDATHEKLLLRRSFSSLWPESVRDRRKQGFGSPMQSWLALPAVQDLRSAYLRDPASPLFDLVERDAVERLSADEDQRTWNLLVLAIWWAHARARTAAS
ncbi:MAG: asparagine synthase (glutamine-hydrolyzing) [Microthrixaceae bacterium]|jgi:asparagine synthase (glutamine-hydrolysing)